jgi:hypothetical protein
MMDDFREDYENKKIDKCDGCEKPDGEDHDCTGCMDTYCFICGETIGEGEKAVELTEGYWILDELSDAECHYVTHAHCIYDLIRREKKLDTEGLVKALKENVADNRELLVAAYMTITRLTEELKNAKT